MDIFKKMWGSEVGCTTIVVFAVWLVQTLIVSYIITYHNGGSL